MNECGKKQALARLWGRSFLVTKQYIFYKNLIAKVQYPLQNYETFHRRFISKLASVREMVLTPLLLPPPCNPLCIFDESDADGSCLNAILGGEFDRRICIYDETFDELDGSCEYLLCCEETLLRPSRFKCAAAS